MKNKDLINKIEDLKTEVNDHMDMDGDYKELIENELNDIKEIVNNINYTRCCTEVCDCEFERIDSKRIQCIKCEMIQSRDS